MRRPVARPRGLTGAAVLFAAASVCALASAAPAVASSGYGQLIVNPGTVSPGQTVSILGTCPNNGSPMTGVFSAAFDGGQASVTQGSVNFSGSATIAGGVSAGQYQVAAKCGPGSPMVVITVTGGGMMPSTPPATAPGGSWSSNPSSSGMTHKYPSPPASLGNAGAGAMGGGTKTTKPASSASAGMSAAAGAGAAAGSSVNATDPPVTSTGIVRVGLAGSGRSNMTTPVAAAAGAAIVITGAVGFLMLRRRRNTPGTHS